MRDAPNATNPSEVTEVKRPSLSGSTWTFLYHLSWCQVSLGNDYKMQLNFRNVKMSVLKLRKHFWM